MNFQIIALAASMGVVAVHVRFTWRHHGGCGHIHCPQAKASASWPYTSYGIGAQNSQVAEKEEEKEAFDLTLESVRNTRNKPSPATSLRPAARHRLDAGALRSMGLSGGMYARLAEETSHVQPWQRSQNRAG